MYRSLLLLWSLNIILFYGCSSTGIHGVISNLKPGDKLYLIQPESYDQILTSYQCKIMDTIDVKSNGSFKCKIIKPNDEVRLLHLVINPTISKYKNKIEVEDPIIGNYLSIIFGPKTCISIHGDANGLFQSYTQQGGGAQNKSLQDLRNAIVASHQKYIAPLEAVNEENLMHREEMIKAYKATVMEWAKNSKHILPSLLAVKYVGLDNHNEHIPEFFYSQCQRWMKQYPDHIYVKGLCQQSTPTVLPLMIGEKFPDLPLPMKGGKTISILDTLGTKMTLVDLWASWCAPCRVENKTTLVPLWEAYHDRGFNIIGYALDSNEKLWINAIEKDGVNRWMHTSHLMGDESPLFEQLQITSIPANYILNKEGIVVAKNLHGEALHSFVRKYFIENK